MTKTCSELFQGMDCTIIGNGNEEVAGLAFRSDEVRPNDMFFCIVGTVVDGHSFAQDAIDRGATSLVAERKVYLADATDVTEVVVSDSRKAMAYASANYYDNPSRAFSLVGITGTNGKTTTTYLVEHIASVAGNRCGVIGTVGNKIAGVMEHAERTTPESPDLQKLFARMRDAGCTVVAMEVSSHALDLRRTWDTDFAVTAFTNLTQDHLDYHGSMEAYRQAKGLLFRQCRKAVLNLDDPAGRWYGERVECPAFTYSENKDAACLTAKNIRLFPGHVEFEAVSREDIQRIHLPIPGGFTIYNALAAISCGLCLGLTLADIAASLRSAKGVRGRVEVVPVPTAYTVLIDYAHTPNALENVLLTARDFTAGRLICLFGCGGDRDRTKRPLMGGVVRELADVAVITSDNPRTEDPWAIIQDVLTGMGGPGGEVHVEPDRRQAIRWALAQGRSGDVIVLAGKGHETVQEVQGVTLPLDEREIVAEYFEKRAQCRERAGNLPAGVV